MFKSIWRAIFGRLPFSDEDERRSAFLLATVLLAVAPMIALFNIILGFEQGFDALLWLVPLIVSLGAIFGVSLLRKGKLKLAASLFVFSAFWVSTWAMGAAGGPTSPAFASTFMPLAIAALVLGFRAVTIVGTGIILALFLVELGPIQELLSAYPLELGPASVMAMRILQIISVGGFFMLAIMSEKRAIKKLRKSRQDLADANKELSLQIKRQSKIADLAKDVLQSQQIEEACLLGTKTISSTLHERPVAYYSFFEDDDIFRITASHQWRWGKELLTLDKTPALSPLLADPPSALLYTPATLWDVPESDAEVQQFILVAARSSSGIFGFFAVPCFCSQPLLREEEVFIEGAAHIIAAAYERLIAQGEVYRLEERRATMVSNSPDGMLSVDQDGRILDCNNAARHIIGVSGDQLFGHRFSDIPSLSEDVSSALESAISELIEKGGSQLFEYEFLQDQDKAPKQIEVRAHQVLGVGNRVSVDLVLRDISERHDAKKHAEQLELELHTARRMETIGRLAGGIAHDFNNLLTVVLMHTSVFQKRKDLPASVLKGAEQIYGSAQRAKRLVHQLLAFARRQPLAPKPLDLGSLIYDLEGLLKRLIPEDVVIQIQVNSEASLIVADHTQVEQVILNLAVNARDAMPDGGTLNIRVCNAGEETQSIDFHRDRPDGDFVLLEVEDNGCGMDDVVMGQIFEPFFTTKDIGEGTGMGLATVYGIVRQHEGAVLVDSKIDKGTVFQVYWPKSDAKKAAAIISTDEDRDIPIGHGERVLVVDDEPLLLETVGLTLKSCGYDVHTVSNGFAAMQVAEELGNIDFLVSDVVMPELGGPDLARALWSTRPELPVLFVSGYSPDRIDEILKENKNVDFLRKPFTPMQVGEKISEMLSQLKAS